MNFLLLKVYKNFNYFLDLVVENKKEEIFKILKSDKNNKISITTSSKNSKKFDFSDKNRLAIFKMKEKFIEK